MAGRLRWLLRGGFQELLKHGGRLPVIAVKPAEDFPVGRNDGSAQGMDDLVLLLGVSEREKVGRFLPLLR